MNIEQAQPYRDKIIMLLTAVNLAIADLPETMDNFIAAIQDGILVGVIGLEVYGNYGLIRSLAVNPKYRRSGIADKLLTHLENVSTQTGLSDLYLFTETAAAYFKQKNYITITRNNVPKAVRQASQFSHVCPLTAIVMKKKL